MRTLNLDRDRLGAIVVREVPTEYVDPSTGEIRYRGRVILPGLYQPQEIRVRTQRPYDGPAGVCTVHTADVCRVTSWYLRGQRGADARSEITLSVDELRPAPGEVPDLVGRDLPVLWPEQIMLLSRNGDRFAAMLESGLYDPDGGVAELTVRSEGVAEGCYPGAIVQFYGVTGRIQLVDREDTGRFAKSKVTLAAQRVEPVAQPATNGRARRESATVAAGAESHEGGDGS